MPVTPTASLATLSVVVPARDEERSIEWAVRALVDGLQGLVALGRLAGGEVVVVDHHSVDGTAAIVAGIGAELAAGPVHARVLAAPDPGGFGVALRSGLAAATGDFVLYTDADLPFDPDDIGRLLRAADRYEADVVCGYRFDRTVEGTRRAIQSYAYNVLVRVVLPIHVRDVNFACKLFRRSVVERLVAELESDGPFIDAEVVARCARDGFRTVQVGVDYFPRFETASTLSGVDAIADILRDLRRLRRGLRSKR